MAGCPSKVNKALTCTILVQPAPWGEVEATPGIEPGFADLQSAASPLRHQAAGGAANWAGVPKGGMANRWSGSSQWIWAIGAQALIALAADADL